MKRDTILSIGQFEFGRFEFSGMEIPPNIQFGGSQHIAKHEMIGGTRVIDCLGRSEKPLEWSGLFQGPTAVQRARYLDGLRVAGNDLLLTWGEFRYTVVIKEFSATYERFYQVPYHISCEVVEDLVQPLRRIAMPPIDQAIADDLAAAQASGDTIADGTLSGLLNTLDSAIKNVSTFARAAQSTIQSVLQPIAAVQARVKILIASTTNAMGNVTTFGGVFPGNKVSVAAAKLSSQITGTAKLGALQNLLAVTGRMNGNIGTINTPGNTKTVAGGNMFSIAQKQYGDQNAWTGIAKANDTTDPFIQGTKTLTIPPQPDTTGGVPQ